MKVIGKGQAETVCVTQIPQGECFRFAPGQGMGTAHLFMRTDCERVLDLEEGLWYTPSYLDSKIVIPVKAHIVEE